ncbi:MAG: hypothetical protein GY746_01330 [Gammaproteobacteria bacterium]|nr:hypothetical protein [Gammaproteobacteria bacterium]
MNTSNAVDWRMAESAALLVEEVLPHQPMRQWVRSFPFQLRLLFASHPGLMCKVLTIIYRAISSRLIKKAGLTQKNAQTGVVMLNQRLKKMTDMLRWRKRQVLAFMPQ